MTERLPQPDFPPYSPAVSDYNSQTTLDWWKEWIGAIVIPISREEGVPSGRPGILSDARRSGNNVESYVSLYWRNASGGLDSADYDLYEIRIVADKKGRLYEETLDLDPED